MQFQRRPSPLLLLDYDGTLADFRINRFEARPWAGVRELLTAIQRQGRTKIAFITGRPAGEIPPMLGLDRSAGGVGTARRRAAVSQMAVVKWRSRHLPCGKPERLRRRQLRRDAFGGLFEDKPNAAVMHWRGHSAAQAQRSNRRTRAIFEPLAKIEGLRLLQFEAGWNCAPAAIRAAQSTKSSVDRRCRTRL